MELLTTELELALKAADRDAMRPLVKFFNPCGAQTWLICHMFKDGDTLEGYCDLGFGCVEFGAVLLSELRDMQLMGGAFSIERDTHIDLTRCLPPEDLLELTTLSGTAALIK